jgi:hypothetical protein
MALALYVVLKQTNKTWATIATALVFVGMAVYLATNIAFSMFALSGQYATATTAAEKAMILAAGQALVAITEGARMIPLMPFAGVLLSVVMLRSKAFGKVTAWLGILGLGLLSASGLFAGYATAGPTSDVMIAIVAVTYAGGGLLSLVWYILVGLRLLKLEPRESKATSR